MCDKVYGLEEIQRLVAPIAVKYDVDRVLLFGSYARGEANGNSDIDFIVEKGRLRGLQLAGMLGDLQERFDKGVDLLTTTGISKAAEDINFRRRVEREMVVVYEQQ